MLHVFRTILRMIKFEHTVFALPFALLSMLVASGGRPGWSTLGWILLAMVGARSTAMAFNRLVDARLDARNPRTRGREIPTGQLRIGPVVLFTVATAALLVLAASQLNRLCLVLSPVALAIVYFYSLTKRFTSFSHVFLGLSLAVAPIGAWIAVRGDLGVFPLLLGGAVLCWVAGFDIIYGCQDTSFDRQAGLHSMSSWLGEVRALRLARAFHVVAVLLWFAAARGAALGPPYVVGVGVVALLLAYEHWLVRGGDLAHIDKAFFEVNSWVGMALLAFAAVDLYWL